MAGDDVKLREGLLQKLRCLLDDELVACTVETVLADTHLLVVLRINRVHRRTVGHRLMKGGVEYGDVGNALKNLLARLDASEIRRHMKRTELHELLALGHNLLGDLYGILEDLGAVKDAMSDSVDILGVAEFSDHLLESLGMILRSPASDALDETLGETLALLHAEELIFKRA